MQAEDDFMGVDEPSDPRPKKRPKKPPGDGAQAAQALEEIQDLPGASPSRPSRKQRRQEAVEDRKEKKKIARAAKRADVVAGSNTATKKCSQCKKTQPLSDFFQDHGVCKCCSNEKRALANIAKRQNQTEYYKSLSEKEQAEVIKGYRKAKAQAEKDRARLKFSVKKYVETLRASTGIRGERRRRLMNETQYVAWATSEEGENLSRGAASAKWQSPKSASITKTLVWRSAYGENHEPLRWISVAAIRLPVSCVGHCLGSSVMRLREPLRPTSWNPDCAETFCAALFEAFLLNLTALLGWASPAL